MRTVIILFVLLAATACQKDRGGSRIEVHVEGAGGQMAYFDKFQNGRPVHVDSVKLGSDGKGRMSLPPLPLDLYRIAIGSEQVIVALDSTENLSLKASKGSLDKPETVEGSKHAQELHRFQQEQRAYEEERDRLRQQIANEPANTEAINAFNALNAANYDRTKAFIEQNSSSPVAITAIARMDMNKEWDLYLKVRDDLRKVMPRSGFFNQYRQRVDQMEQQMLAIKMQEEEMKRQSSFLPVGSEAPEIRQQTPDGGTYALSQLRGKVVLIDFWASWCRPCRIENPAVKQVYQKYRNKGFEILGVSLDRSHDAWVQAIQQDGLPWKHVSDLGFWQNAAAQEYGVNSIPYTVLLDREGKIIEKGLRAHDLDARLAQIFGS